MVRLVLATWEVWLRSTRAWRVASAVTKHPSAIAVNGRVERAVAVAAVARLRRCAHLARMPPSFLVAVSVAVGSSRRQHFHLATASLQLAHVAVPLPATGRPLTAHASVFEGKIRRVGIPSLPAARMSVGTRVGDITVRTGILWVECVDTNARPDLPIVEAVVRAATVVVVSDPASTVLFTMIAVAVTGVDKVRVGAVGGNQVLPVQLDTGAMFIALDTATGVVALEAVTPSLVRGPLRAIARTVSFQVPGGRIVNCSAATPSGLLRAVAVVTLRNAVSARVEVLRDADVSVALFPPATSSAIALLLPVTASCIALPVEASVAVKNVALVDGNFASVMQRESWIAMAALVAHARVCLVRTTSRR